MTETEWTNIDTPDYQDGNRRIEVEREDGSTAIGRLDLRDVTPGPDEAPIWDVVIDGRAQFIFDFKRWRLLDD